MLIEIHLTERRPPRGQVIRVDRRRVDFEGWVGLLRVLAEEITPSPGTDDAHPPPGG